MMAEAGVNNGYSRKNGGLALESHRVRPVPVHSRLAPPSDECRARAARSRVVVLYSILCLLVALIPVEIPRASAEVSVSSSLSPREAGPGDSFVLTVTVSGARGSGIRPPDVENNEYFSVSSVRRGQELSVGFGGTTSQATSFEFLLEPRRMLPPGSYKLRVPPVRYGSDELAVPEQDFKILPEGKEPSWGAASQRTGKQKVFVGEQVSYEASFTSSLDALSREWEDPQSSELLIESFEKEVSDFKIVGNKTAYTYSTRGALFPLVSGSLEVPSRGVTVQAFKQEASRRGPMFDLVFPDLSMMERTPVRERFIAAPVQLQVMPLPPPPQKITYTVPVGDVRLDTELSQTDVTQGSGVTLTLSVSGNANLRPFTLPKPWGKDIARFRVYAEEPSVKSSTDGRSIVFEKIFRVTFVPEQSGELTLPEYAFFYFNPSDGQYHKLSTGERVLQVTPSAQFAASAPPEATTAAAAPIASAEPAQPPQPAPTAVQDLRLQKPVLYESPAGPAPGMLWLYLVLPALAVGLRSLTARVKQLVAASKSPTYPRVLAKAERSIQDAEASGALGPDRLLKICLDFLFECAGIEGNSMHRILASLAPALTPDTKKELEELLRSLEKLKYSGAELSPADMGTLAQQAKRLFQEVVAQLETRKATSSRSGEVFAVLLVGLLMHQPALADDSPRSADEVFVEANDLYGQGNFAEAARRYQELVDRNIVSPSVYYNLGNALEKGGAHAKALQAMLIAAELSPSDDDILHNLSLMRKNGEEYIPRRATFLPSAVFPSRERIAWFAIAVNLLLWIAFVLVPRESRWLRYGVLGSLGVITVSLVGLYFFAQNIPGKGAAIFLGGRPAWLGVVDPDVATVYAGNATHFQTVAQATSGTELEVEEERGQWSRVTLPDGREGWLQTSTLLPVIRPAS